MSMMVTMQEDLMKEMKKMPTMVSLMLNKDTVF
jgi:hypothetical protein